MQSDAPVDDITKGHDSYDKLVRGAGFTSASDKLGCSQQLSYKSKAAVDRSAGIGPYQVHHAFPPAEGPVD